jgi:predicted DNA binding CopG/RHH family protein
MMSGFVKLSLPHGYSIWDAFKYHEKMPTCKTEAEERDFGANADSPDYVDWSKARRVLLPNIKPSLKTISLRLPELMIDELKLIANKRDVPYQSLIKIFLSERLSKELNA